MFHFKNNYSKRKPRREYLYDEFSPQKSNLVVWLQRLILLVALIIIAMFILSLNSLANAYGHTHSHYSFHQNALHAETATVERSHSSSLPNKVLPTFKRDDAKGSFLDIPAKTQHAPLSGKRSRSDILSGVALLLLGLLSQLIHQPLLKEKLRQWQLM